jgi:hypothetical protein
METLCLRNAQTRYIVSIGDKILVVMHNYHFAKRLDAEIRSRKITDESYTVIPGRQK